jgi:hypothetical protein
MRLVWRRFRPEEFNHELIWLVMSVAAVAAGVVWLGLGLPGLACPFRAVTGYPCLSMAWSWNPLAFIALCGVVLFDLYAAAVLLTRSPRLRVIDWTRAEKNAVRVAVVVLIAVNWAYLFAHRGQF